MNPAPETGLLFVVGLPRSGTSLLYALLSGHPGIALMFEAEFECAPGLVWRHGPDAALRKLEFFNQALSRHRIPLEEGRAHCTDSAALAHWCYRHMRERKPGAVWGGEKSPQYSGRLAELGRKFPGASFIVITRELAATVASARVAAETGASFFRRGSWISRNYRMGRKMLRAAGDLLRAGRRVHFVSYSDLVNRPLEECSRICAFLGLPEWPAMVQLDRDAAAAVPEGRHHDRVRSGEIGPSASKSSVLAAADQALCSRCDAVLRQELGLARGLPEHPAVRRGLRLRLLEVEGAFRLLLDRVRLCLLMLLPIAAWRTIRHLRHGSSGQSAPRPACPHPQAPPVTEGSGPLALLHGGRRHSGLLVLLSGNPPADAAVSIRTALACAGVQEAPEFVHTLDTLDACCGRALVISAPGSAALAGGMEHLLTEASARGIQIGLALFDRCGRCSLGFAAAEADAHSGGWKGKMDAGAQVSDPLPRASLSVLAAQEPVGAF